MGFTRFFRRRRWDEERTRELESYLAEAIDDNLARGMTPGAARAAAHRKLGNATRIREDIYEFNTVRWLETLRFDVRDAWRQLRRRRLAAVTTVALLAAGVAGSTAAFCVVYGILFRSLPFPEPERLATLVEVVHGRHEQVSYPDLQDLRTLPAFESVAAVFSGRVTLAAGAAVDRVGTVAAEPALLPMLGARAAQGRLLMADDAGRRVTVVSHRLWARLLQRDPAIVGRTVRINGQATTVIGVLAEDPAFELPVGGGVSGVAFTIKDVDLWTPFDATDRLAGNRAFSTYEAIVRLRPGATLAGAQSAVDGLGASLARQFPATNAGRGFRLIPLRDQMVDAGRPAVWFGFGGAALVLLIAIVNAMGLTLGELPSRRRELATRLALGASRGRLVRQIVVESVLIGAAAGGLGVLLAQALVGAFVRAIALPRASAIQFDVPVAVFAAAVALAAALVARLLPLLRAGGATGGLRASASPPASGAARFRRVLVAAQLAITVLVCATAALLGTSLRAVLTVDPGFSTDRVLSARVSAYAAAHPEKADVVRFFTDLVSAVRDSPGLEGAAATSSLPLSGANTGTSVMAEGRPVPEARRPSAGWEVVTPGYFAVQGIRLRNGRDFAAADLRAPAHHVIVNEALARLLFGDADPIGHRILIGSQDPENDWHEVVGVVGDVRHGGLTAAPGPRAYDLFGEHWSRTLFLVARGSRDATATLPLIRAAVQRLDPEAPVFDVRTLDTLVEQDATSRRAATAFVGGVAVLTLLLAAAGVYGLLAETVASRARELGIRRALGCAQQDIMSLVLRESLVLAASGATAGVVLSAAFAGLIQSQLYGVAATDPRVLAAVVLTLLLTAVLASLGPARRAARVDPAIVLRSE
jgi:putative ABC transport system permease protein